MGEATLLRVAAAGSVDDGKSTLIGRLLVDTKQVFDDQLESVRSADGDGVNLAHLTDGLRGSARSGPSGTSTSAATSTAVPCSPTATTARRRTS